MVAGGAHFGAVATVISFSRQPRAWAPVPLIPHDISKRRRPFEQPGSAASKPVPQAAPHEPPREGRIPLVMNGRRRV